ncbi:MAG: Tad domain-containing protein [Coriobacteriia bacterium]|nr:Tad domain-containing protein [Coriobacteriia bacterium]
MRRERALGGAGSRGAGRRHIIPALRGDEGATATVVAVLFAFGVLFGVAMTVVDAGSLYATRRNLQSAADAGALAGVQQLPSDTAGAAADADIYVQENAAFPVEWVTSSFSSTTGSGFTDTIHVTVRGTAPVFFARWFGHGDKPIEAGATAVVGSPTTYESGVMPFGILAEDLAPPYGLPLGEEYTLKLAAGDASQGNYHIVDLTSFSDENNTKNLIKDGGSSQPISIGDTFPTQPGNVQVPNYKALNDYLSGCDHEFADLVHDASGIYKPPLDPDGVSCRRFIVCPVVVIDGLAAPECFDWEETTGATYVRVIGFLNVFVRGDADADAGTMTGRLLQVASTEMTGRMPLQPYAGVRWWLEE